MVVPAKKDKRREVRVPSFITNQMKRLLLSMAIIMIACVSAVAQVPTVMMYQVQVKHGKTAAQDVTIEMQLRRSQTGSTVWNQTFNLTSVKNGSVQNLGLDFGKQINWNEGEYWLATIIDGEEMGCAKLTSVPYALVAKETEGSINSKNIIGKWKCIDSEKGYVYSIEFKEDGTFNYENYRGKLSGTFRILANGVIYTHVSNSEDKELCDAVSKIDDNHIMTITDSGRFGKMKLYTRE